MAKSKTEAKTTEEVIEELDKEYGRGSVIHGGEVESYSDVIPTGSLGLDLALGIGGIALGKITEIYGWESSGKSTLSQTIIGNAQKKDIKCLYVDGENSLDEVYAKNLGVNMDDLLILQLDEHGGEGAYNKAERLVEAGEIKLVVYDSYNALKPKGVVVEGEMGDSAIGKHSRLMGQVCDKANYLAKRYNCAFIFIGQMREKIGVMFGSPETTQGGNALKFYAHTRIEIRKSVLKDGDEPYANRTKAKVVKNKLAPPFKVAEFEVIFGEGIDRVGEIIELGVKLGILEKKGSYFYYETNSIGQGTDKVKQLLKDNPELANEIEEKIKEVLYGSIVA